jgi:plasmid maintenance system antidote protein VapI
MIQLERGQQAKVARELNISAQHMNDIIKGRKRPSLQLAAKLEEATGISRLSWLYPDESHNPLISGPAAAAANQ